MAISFQSDEEVLRKLRNKLRKMSDEELIKFGKDVRRHKRSEFLEYVTPRSWHETVAHTSDVNQILAAVVANNDGIEAVSSWKVSAKLPIPVHC